MTSLGPRENDKLDGASNITPWKCKQQMLLVEVDLWGFIENKVTPPIDLIQLVKHNKKAKAKRIILDSVKDQLIPHITEKKTVKDM
jgi:hypothetical protein